MLKGCSLYVVQWHGQGLFYASAVVVRKSAVSAACMYVQCSPVDLWPCNYSCYVLLCNFYYYSTKDPCVG